MSSYISTVKGNIDNSQLLFCHSHEHLFIRDGQSAKLNPSLRIDDFEKTIAELNLYKSVGGNSIVDAQPIGCGRIAEWLLQASELTGVNIIASTGFHKLMFYPKDHWIHTIDAGTLAEVYVNEIENGMYIDADSVFPSVQIDAKAGVIKVAADADGINDKNKNPFIAASIASKLTGTPILCHTEMGKKSLELIEFFTSKGIDSNSIILCHVDRTMDNSELILEVARLGVYLEFDTIARHKYHSDSDEVQLISKLVEKGFEDQLLLGLDTTRDRLKSYGGSIGLDYVQNIFLPLLKQLGINEGIYNKFMIANPANAFCKKIKE
jgi:5-phospho-D-xylono-1,4-lactonase